MARISNSWRKSYRSSGSAKESSDSSRDGDMDDICCVCYGKVSWLERLEFMDEIYHSKCFKCTDCGRKLHLGQFVDHDCKPYCHACYHKAFEMKNKGLMSPISRKSSKIWIDTDDPLQGMKHKKSGKLNMKAFCEKYNIPTTRKSNHSIKKQRQRQSKDVKNCVNKYRKSAMRFMNDTDPDTMSSDFDTDLLVNPQNYSEYASDCNQCETQNNKINKDTLDDLRVYFQVYTQDKFDVMRECMNKQILNMQKDMMRKIDHMFDLIKSGDVPSVDNICNE